MDIDFSKGLERFNASANQNAIDRLIALKADIAAAEKKGLFVPLPASEPDRSRDVFRIKTIRNRLTNLGYLAKDSGRPYLDEDLTEAIRTFQQEAGLTVDGWVGEETWSALQELVSFETPLNVMRWFEGGKSNPALRRAIGLRFFVLGMSENKPDSPDQDFFAGFQKFGQIWHALQQTDLAAEPSENLIWINRLFDQDTFVELLAGMQAPSDKQKLIEIHGFVINVAKIELWLAGYDARPSGYDLEEQSKPPPGEENLSVMDIWMKSSTVTQYLRINRNLRFYRSIVKFWKDLGKESENANRLSLNFLDDFPQFFRVVAQGLRAYKELRSKEQCELIVEKLEKRPEEISAVWKNVRKLGNRIWDGTRRVWGWLKNIVRSAVKKVIVVGRNLSRLIYDYALRAYEVVSNTLSSVEQSLSLLIRRHLSISDSAIAIVSHDRDLDFMITVNSSADPNAVELICGKLIFQTRIFRFACRLFGVFLSILLSVIRNGRFGYFGLVLALVKFRGHWDRIRSLYAEYRTFFLQA